MFICGSGPSVFQTATFGRGTGTSRPHNVQCTDSKRDCESYVAAPGNASPSGEGRRWHGHCGCGTSPVRPKWLPVAYRLFLVRASLGTRGPANAVADSLVCLMGRLPLNNGVGWSTDWPPWWLAVVALYPAWAGPLLIMGSGGRLTDPYVSNWFCMRVFVLHLFLFIF